MASGGGKDLTEPPASEFLPTTFRHSPTDALWHRAHFRAMLDSLHLIRLLRQALTSFALASSEGERDRVTRQLIADLEFSLLHQEAVAR